MSVDRGGPPLCGKIIPYAESVTSTIPSDAACARSDWCFCALVIEETLVLGAGVAAFFDSDMMVLH